MDKKIVWSALAAENLDSICGFIAKDSPFYASLFAQRILEIIDSLPLLPRAGRIVPEYRQDNLRERFYKSYRIVYRIKTDIIEIVAIVNFARLIQNNR